MDRVIRNFGPSRYPRSFMAVGIAVLCTMTFVLGSASPWVTAQQATPSATAPAGPACPSNANDTN